MKLAVIDNCRPIIFCKM